MRRYLRGGQRGWLTTLKHFQCPVEVLEPRTGENTFDRDATELLRQRAQDRYFLIIARCKPDVAPFGRQRNGEVPTACQAGNAKARARVDD
jgi:hypothetical protein